MPCKCVRKGPCVSYKCLGILRCKRVIQECLGRVSCNASVSCKTVLQALHKRVLQACFVRVLLEHFAMLSCKSVEQEYFARVSCKSASQTCDIRVSEASSVGVHGSARYLIQGCYFTKHVFPWSLAPSMAQSPKGIASQRISASSPTL